jgi:AcrR family transcriptional regulator
MRRGAPPERWQEVVDTSAELFYRLGYASASISDLAEALGITKGSLYYYVKTKEDLLFEIIEQLHALTLENVRRSQAVPGTVADRLLDYFAGHVSINTTYLHKAAVAHRELDQLSARRRRTVVAKRDQAQAYVRQLLAEGQATHEVCPDLDIDVTSIFMFSTANSVQNWFKPDHRLDAVEVSDQLAEYIVAGVRCHPRMHTLGHRGRS